MSLQNISLPSDAVSALERGNKIEAIKITRETAWMTLKQAKLATEAFLDENPSLKAKCEPKKNAGGILLIAVSLFAVIAIIAAFLQ